MKPLILLLSVAILLAIAFNSAHAASFGFSASGNYHVSSDMPAGYWIDTGERERYRADLTVYARERGLLFSAQPYMSGAGSPDVAGLNAGVGLEMGAVTVSVYHHSCHNLDRAGWMQQGTSWQPAPDCSVNGIKVRLSFGESFQPLW